MNTLSTNSTQNRTRRGLTKLLLATAASFCALAMTGLASALPIVNPGDGSLPPEAAEASVYTLKSYAPRKSTKLVNATPAFTIRNGQTVTISAQLYYRDKNGNWKPLNYTRVPVEFNIGRYSVISTMTNSNGVASVTVTIKDPWRLSYYGKRVSWRATFRGDIELYKCSISNYFQLKP